MNQTTEERLLDHVKSIADMLSDSEKMEKTMTEDNGYSEEEHGSLASFYLEDVLDIQYIVNSSKEYLGARLLVAFGGPNIWIDTRTKTVEGYWWSDKAEYSFIDDIGLDDYMEEVYNCI